MSADKFQQLSDAFLKISQGFAEVASIMGSNLEPTGMTGMTVSTVSTSISASTPTDTTTISEPAAKKVKKEKDPNAPKRPLNAYFLFQRDYRLKLKASHPEASFAEVQQLMNEAWEKMPFEEKTKYENEAKGLYEVYNKELREYKGQISNVTEGIEKAETPSDSPKPIEQVIETKTELPIIATTASSDAEPAKKKKKKKNRENRESKEGASESQE